MPFKATGVDIESVLVIEPAVFRDGRGAFSETYRYSEFTRLGIDDRFLQDNHSQSSKNVVRGLHYQIAPKAQAKLIRCCRGKIFDVCVDIRKGSPTFGRWFGLELTEENFRMLYIPRGFAHGFASLSEGAEIIYKCSEEYSRDHDRGILWNDPAIGIRWPVQNPILSEKDMKNPPLKDADNAFVY